MRSVTRRLGPVSEGACGLMNLGVLPQKNVDLEGNGLILPLVFLNQMTAWRSRESAGPFEHWNRPESDDSVPSGMVR